MSIELYPSVAKIKRNGVYQNLPGFVPETGSVATQQMIATAESSNVAQYAHNKGEYFRLNDTLYQAIVRINVGDSIVVGTNCEVAVLGNDVTHIANSIAEYELGIATSAHATGEYFMVGETLYVATNDIAVGDSISTSTNCRLAVVGDELSGVQTALSRITTEEVSVNKVNIDSPLTEHYYLWQSGTKVSSGSSHYFISNPIAVKAGDVLRRNVTTASGIQFGAYVNADNTPNTPGATIYDKGEEYTATRDGYISVNFPASRLQNAMVTINTPMPDEFVPYHDDKILLSNEIHLNTTQLEDVKKYGSVLNGKKIAYNGDSICESRINTGTSNNGGAYAKLIADYVGGIYENRGLSGGILASAVGDGGSTPTRCVVSDITNMASDADLICFEGGINDYWRDVPLGTYTESDYSSTLDTTTICGALESIFRQATAKWIGKPIVFIITHKITSTVYAENSAGYTWTDVHEKMVGICKKYAIPYYDAFEESGLNAYNSIQNTNFLTSNATGNPDGCHPNEAAYRRYYVPQLIALFESVMPILEDE